MRIKITLPLFSLLLGFTSIHIQAQELEEFRYQGEDLAPLNNTVRNEFQFNGFTNYWHDTYTHWYGYGNLFKMAIPNVEKNILQSKVDIAEDMGIPGLVMQEGFITNLISASYKVLEHPDRTTLEHSLRSGNVLVFINLENLSFLQDETLPLHAKARTIKWWFDIYHELYIVYTNVRMKRQYYIRELVDIDIFGVGMVHKMLDLGNEINESEDPSDVAMQSGVPAIQQMYLDLLIEVFEKQQHTSRYPEQTLELLSDSLSNSVRRNMHWFDEDAFKKI
ncbi:MAG: hypothetical protein KAR16_11940 [Bacteroidales bacterium]|nr:hypothetical protein [Bacteroidales bacterium]